jgi:hypothetical protein
VLNESGTIRDDGAGNAVGRSSADPSDCNSGRRCCPGHTDAGQRDPETAVVRPTSYQAPAQLPISGNWAGSLSHYGDVGFFQFSARANRTLSIIVNALDESSSLSQNKAMPVIGMWALDNPGQSPAPANTHFAFNSTSFGKTRLDVQILQSTNFRLGIADYRGDGRPDYRYTARVFYGDIVSPTRASVAGGTPLTIQGIGLQPNTSVRTGGVAVPVLASSAKRLLANTKPIADGVYSIVLKDPDSGGSSNMSGGLTVGPTDTIKISGANPGTPVGGQAPSPFTVMVVAADGITPVAGASVQFSSAPSVAFSNLRLRSRVVRAHPVAQCSATRAG